MADFDISAIPYSISSPTVIGEARSLNMGVFDFSIICAKRTDFSEITIYLSSKITNRSETINSGNYSISGPSILTVEGVSIGDDNDSVVLLVSGEFLAGNYTVTVAAGTVFGEWSLGTTPTNSEIELPVEILEITPIPPSVEDLLPAPGTEISPATPITFSVQHGTSDISLIVVTIETAGRTEIAFDGEIFGAYYGESTYSVVDGDYFFSIVRTVGGWISGVALRVYAVGNEDEVAA